MPNFEHPSIRPIEAEVYDINLGQALRNSKHTGSVITPNDSVKVDETLVFEAKIIQLPNRAAINYARTYIDDLSF